MKGSRVQSIIRELRGEKIDIIEHSDDLVTFAQSALAPAKITRVSVTHQGEVPHLDVIVEDEQLSLAIGKRGQNVRLASELIGARIDIKSETDVKDEVADALARMLQSAMAQAPVSQRTAFDITAAPGVGAKTAGKLKEAGFGELEGLLAATAEDLQQVEGVGPKTAQAILAWAAEQGEKWEAVAAAQAAAPETEAAAAATSPPPEPHSPATMADEDFMAALSRALAESDQQRADLKATQEAARAEASAAAAIEAQAAAEAEARAEAAEKTDEALAEAAAEADEAPAGESGEGKEKA
jgi:N utilization substance protein A